MMSVSKSGRTLSLLLTLSLGFLTLGLLAYSIILIWTPDESTETVSEGATDGYVVGYDDRDMVYPEDSKGSPATNEEDQVVVKTGSVDMSVKDLDDSSAKIRRFAKEVGGYVESLYDTGEDNDRTVAVTIRIPAAAFDSTMKKVKDLGVDIDTSDESTSDITLAYTDLQARLENQQALEAQLLEILGQATKISDILEVQSQLSAVRENIESLQSQIDYYDAQVEMSTVTVYMSQSTVALDVNSEPWRPSGVFNEALASLVYLLKSLGSLLIWLVVFSPVVLVPWWVYKAFSRGKKK